MNGINFSNRRWIALFKSATGIVATLFVLNAYAHCSHSFSMGGHVAGTNALGQLVFGKAHPGDTVGVFLVLEMLDDCPGDQTIATSIIDTRETGCYSVTTPNLLSEPLRLTFFEQFVAVNGNLDGSFSGFAYTYVVPDCAADRIVHTCQVMAHDTNSVTNMGGVLQAGGSAQIEILRPAIRASLQCFPNSDGTIFWRGSITNCGNTTLSNVIARHFLNGTNEMVLGPDTLTPGQVAIVAGGYRPDNVSRPSISVLRVEGTDELLLQVEDAVSCSVQFPPTLRITRSATAGGQVVVSWPEAFSSFTLQCASNPSPAAAWISLGEGQAIGGGQVFVRLPVTMPAMFFRLVSP